MALSHNLRGALFMSVAMAGFTANDAVTKIVSTSMNVGQVMLIRGAFATLMIALLAWHFGALRSLGMTLRPTVLVRVVAEIGAAVTFLTALFHMPLANVSAVLQALPLAVTMGAALVLAEPVGWRRWSAIAAGFAGVMIIVRPGFEGFNAFSLLAVTTVALCAVRDIATRRIPTEIPTLLISLATSAAVTVAGAFLVVPFGGWSAPTPSDVALLFAAAVMLIFGYQFIILSMRAGEISFIAPFRYTALLWAIALGFVVFGDIPDLPMIVGAGIVIGSGLYALYREQIAGTKRPIAQNAGAPPAPEGTAPPVKSDSALGV